MSLSWTEIFGFWQLKSWADGKLFVRYSKNKSWKSITTIFTYSLCVVYTMRRTTKSFWRRSLPLSTCLSVLLCSCGLSYEQFPEGEDNTYALSFSVVAAKHSVSRGVGRNAERGVLCLLCPLRCFPLELSVFILQLKQPLNVQNFKSGFIIL